MKPLLILLLGCCVVFNADTVLWAKDKPAIFGKLTLVTISKGKPDKEKIRLRMQDDELMLESKDGKKVIHKLRYADLQEARYQTEEKPDSPKRLGAGLGAFSGGIVMAQASVKHQAFGWIGLALVGVGTHLIQGELKGRETRWLMLKTEDQTYRVGLNWLSYGTICRELEARGIKVIGSWRNF